MLHLVKFILIDFVLDYSGLTVQLFVKIVD